jgi:hypothetical protein
VRDGPHLAIQTTRIRVGDDLSDDEPERARGVLARAVLLEPEVLAEVDSEARAEGRLGHHGDLGERECGGAGAAGVGAAERGLREGQDLCARSFVDRGGRSARGKGVRVVCVVLERGA